MKGYIIRYKPYDNNSRVNLHHTLFGRIMYRNYRGRKYAYYVQGMLDKTPFIRLMDSKIFVRDIDNINFEELRIMADVITEECNRELILESLKTGEEYWQEFAKEKGLPIRVRKRKWVKEIF